MSNHERQRKDAIQDLITPGLSLEERADIRSTIGALQMVFNLHDTKPLVAYGALLNVLGALIGTVLVADKEELTRKAQETLPLYVEAYRVREKKLPGQ